MAEVREFIDEDRPVMDKYYDLTVRNNSVKRSSVKKRLKQLIKEDPDFLDTYLSLYWILLEEGKKEEAKKILDEAYQRALNLITDKKGNWPDLLEWKWLENRHIIRALVNKGISLWDEGKTEEALKIFRKLLRMNPGDGPGVRYFILAIRMGMSFEEFDKKFEEGGYWTSEIEEWFDANCKLFPEEFEWWEKLWEE
jgi:tetratricopeptide (TPR) repeat protein